MDEEQERQRELIRDTGNGPTVPNEGELLAELYGDQDENGVYGGVR